MDDDVLQEKIREYRKMLKLDRPDLDLALLLKILDIMNDSSEVKVAIEPVSESGEWIADTPTYTVCNVKRLDDGRLVLRVNNEKHGMTVGDLYVKLTKEMKRTTGKSVPVLFMKGSEVVQLTEAFSHTMTNEQWAGLPFDLVLGVRKRPSDSQKSETHVQKVLMDQSPIK